MNEIPGVSLRQIDAILSFVQDVSGPWPALISISHTYMIFRVSRGGVGTNQGVAT